jgi:hypothetical protein
VRVEHRQLERGAGLGVQGRNVPGGGSGSVAVAVGVAVAVDGWQWMQWIIAVSLVRVWSELGEY